MGGTQLITDVATQVEAFVLSVLLNLAVWVGVALLVALVRGLKTAKVAVLGALALDHLDAPLEQPNHVLEELKLVLHPADGELAKHPALPMLANLVILTHAAQEP